MDIPRSALEAEARVYERLKRAHAQRLKSQTKQTEDDMHAAAGHSSNTRGSLHQDSEAANIPSTPNETQDPSVSIVHQGTRAGSAQARTTSEPRLTVDDLARSFENVPKSTLEAQVREYERLHQIHAQRIQSQSNLTKDDVGATAGSGNDSRDGHSGGTHGTLHQANETAGIPSNDPQTSAAPSGDCSIDDCSIATDPKTGQQLTALGNATVNGCGVQAGTKPLPEQCRSYGIPHKTKYHTKLVRCIFCSSLIYTDPSTAIICCQECGMSFCMKEVERWDGSTSDGRGRP